MSSGRFYGVLFFSMLPALFVAALWPFDFRPENHVSFLPDAGGVRFEVSSTSLRSDPGGLLFTPSALAYPVGAAGQKGTSIEIRLMASSELSSCLKRIVEFRDAAGAWAFSLGQWRSFFIARAFIPDQPEVKPKREIGIRGALEAGRESFVTVTSGPEGTALYLDGSPIEQNRDLRLLGQTQSLEGATLYLGNSPDLACAWSGDIYGLALYSRVMSPSEVRESFGRWKGDPASCGGFPDAATVASYRFGGSGGEIISDLSGAGNDLRMPSRLVFKRDFLEPIQFRRFNYVDVLLNILGFMPLGLLWVRWVTGAFGWQPGKSVWTAVLCGFAISLAIETTQVLLPSRVSSQTDVVCNTLGVLLGALAASVSFGRNSHKF
jgi:hypothetical protein